VCQMAPAVTVRDMHRYNTRTSKSSHSHRSFIGRAQSKTEQDTFKVSGYGLLNGCPRVELLL
jgi:hypothetical protein